MPRKVRTAGFSPSLFNMDLRYEPIHPGTVFLRICLNEIRIPLRCYSKNDYSETSLIRNPINRTLLRSGLVEENNRTNVYIKDDWDTCAKRIVTWRQRL
ncbi:hypothetical protein M514_10373 [Trichuris suis]|uniref:Uncharacterized protein n=1 Tax=Trichuris suis TaxID=68888 RepID=A0A085NEL1_9BILA|nr:hypothetical protein M513_10373 [Trichuris suis]KFD67907.1 hypothetical protein M514_10373 [Trichuris suis]